MTAHHTFRRILQATVACAAVCLPAVAAAVSEHQNAAPAPPPVVRQQYPDNAPAFRAGVPVYHSQPAGQRAYVGPTGHLSQWMEAHKSLTPLQQEQALEREPGFRQLPAQEQQRVLARLQQLNAMLPEQRERVLARAETMERLTPTQRQVVTGTMAQLHALPVERQRAVARAFRNLRQLPPEQRQAAADYYARQFSPQERETLNSLLRAEPYLPVKHPPAYPPPPPYGPQ